MHDAPPVDIRERTRNIRPDPGDKCWLGRAFEQLGAQVDPVHEFEHEERSAMVTDPTLRNSVEERDQAGGVQGSEQLNLITLPTHVIGIRELRAKNFERHGTTERFIYAPVNGCHAAHSHDRFDAESIADKIAGGELGGRRPVRMRAH